MPLVENRRVKLGRAHDTVCMHRFHVEIRAENLKIALKVNVKAAVVGAKVHRELVLGGKKNIGEEGEY